MTVPARNAFYLAQSQANGPKLRIACDLGIASMPEVKEFRSLYMVGLAVMAKAGHDIRFFIRPPATLAGKGVEEEIEAFVKGLMRETVAWADHVMPESFYGIHHTSDVGKIFQGQPVDIVIDGLQTDWCDFKLRIAPNSLGFKNFLLNLGFNQDLDPMLIATTLMQRGAGGITAGHNPESTTTVQNPAP